MKEYLKVGMLSLVLVFGFIMMSCPNETTPVDDGPGGEITEAETPVISTQPDESYTVSRGNSNPSAITVGVQAPTDGGTLTYQWYRSLNSNKSNPVPIPGATSATYNPVFTDADPDSFYIWLTITNSTEGFTDSSEDSRVITIILTTLVDAQTPVIKSLSVGYTYYEGDDPNGNGSPYWVTAEVDDGGVLSYMWMISYNQDFSDAEPLPGGAVASYTPLFVPVDYDHEYRYVWCVVTNTNTGVNGNQTATDSSTPIAVRITRRVDAQKPLILTLSSNDGYFDDETPEPLIVTYEPITDGGTLSIQWYRSDTDDIEDAEPIDGDLESTAVTATYVVPAITTEGIYLFYVVLTNENLEATGATQSVTQSETITITISSRVNAEYPTIDVNPAISTEYVLGDTIVPLTLSASLKEEDSEGVLSYEWFQSDTDSNTGGTSVSASSASPDFTPEITTAGTYYYYAVVTNTDTSKNGVQESAVHSNVAIIVMWQYANAAAPTITTEPQDGNHARRFSTVITPLSVSASVNDGGTLSYQWYSSNAQSEKLIAIGVGTQAAYTPAIDDTNDVYYFLVVVTNTNDQAKNVKTAETTSRLVTVTIVRPAVPANPVISVDPADLNLPDVFAFDLPIPTAVLSVTAAEPTDEGTLSYQWYRATSNSAAGVVISGATEATYQPDQNAYYYVEVTNNLSYAIAKTATVASTRAQVNASKVPDSTITVNNTTKRQFIRGVGGMHDQCFIFGNGSWTDPMTLENVQAMFGNGPNELGLNMYRVLMYPYLEEGIVGYTRSPLGAAYQAGNPDQGIVDNINAYTFGNGASKSGTMAQTQEHYYEIIKKVNDLGGYVLLTPWVIPLQFTRSTNTGDGSVLGNGTGSGSWVNPAMFNELADWYVDYIKNLEAHGAHIFALSVQNEPDQGVAYDGCRWQTNDQRDLIRVLGPKLKAAVDAGEITPYGGGRVWDMIWIGTGDNAGLPGAAGDATANDTGADGASQWTRLSYRHLYGSMSKYTNGWTHINDPAKGLREVWMTEHCDTTSAGRDSSYNDMSNWNWSWHFSNETYLTFNLNEESAMIWWTTKRFYGFFGEGNFTTTNGAILPRGHHAAHFGKYVLNTYLIDFTISGNYVENLGIAAGNTNANLGATTLPIVKGTNLNPTAFAQGNSNTGGQNVPITKIMAFEADDGSYISLVLFTPTRNSGYGGQDMGNVYIELPNGFVAQSVQAMRSTATVKQQPETVKLVNGGTGALINMPRSNMFSVKFIKAD